MAARRVGGGLQGGRRPSKFVRALRAQRLESPQHLGGAVAQLGERLTGSQEVDGSIPFSSTILRARRLLGRRKPSSMSSIPLPSAPHDGA